MMNPLPYLNPCKQTAKANIKSGICLHQLGSTGIFSIMNRFIPILSFCTSIKVFPSSGIFL